MSVNPNLDIAAQLAQLQAQVQQLSSATQGAAAVQSDLVAQTLPSSQKSVPSTTAAATPASWLLPPFWSVELLDTGGGPYLPQDDVTDWGPLFDNPALPKYNLKHPTSGGELDHNSWGMGCERRYTLTFSASTNTTIQAYLSVNELDTGDVPRSRIQMNGGALDSSAKWSVYDGSGANVIMSWQVPISIREGTNVLTVSTNYFVQHLYLGIDLSSFCQFSGGK